MEMLLSAVLGEAITRSINFFVSRRSKLEAQDVEGCLGRVLLRAQVIIDEAMERQITSQAMLLQLDMLRGAVHRGHYMLDTLRYQSHDNKDDARDEDEVASQSLPLCKVNVNPPRYFFCSSSRKPQVFRQLPEVLDSLNAMIRDAGEMMVFLKSYPRMYRQPYSMHLLLANCMFDRQTETQLAINFLLHTKPCHDEEPEVLPIVGPRQVGKSTLVAHVCRDERIRDRFSDVVFLTDDALNGDLTLPVLGQGFARENRSSATGKDRRLLVIVEVAGDVTEDAWKQFCSAIRRSTVNSSSSKIIITSRSEQIARLGTTGAITLAYTSNEAYWYFFKTLTFGSMDPDQYSRFVPVAMEIARTMNNGAAALYGASHVSSFLRDNFDIKIWRKILALNCRLIRKHVAKFGEHPWDLMNQNRPVRLGRMMGESSEVFMVWDQYERSSQEAVPNITLHDVMYGSLKPRGKFEALVWRSQLPPYYNYIYTCQILDLKAKDAKRKRSEN